MNISRQVLLTWLLPGCSVETASVMYPKADGLGPGWINNESDVARAIDAYWAGTLAKEVFQSVTMDGKPYSIAGGERLGLVLHREGRVARFCCDFDDHAGDGGNVHLADAVDKFLGVQALRFTSKSGRGLHCYYALAEPVPVEQFVAWTKAWNFNRDGDVECFPKSEKRTQIWLPNEPNEHGGDAYVSGDFESCVVQRLPEGAKCKLSKEALNFLRGFAAPPQRNIALNKTAFECAKKRMDEAEARALCLRGAELCGLLAEESAQTQTTFESGFRAGSREAGPKADDQGEPLLRDQLLRLSYDLTRLAKSSLPVNQALRQAEAQLGVLTASIDRPQAEFHRITAAELASAKYELTYLVEGILVKDQPAGLVGPKKTLKTNVSLDLAVSLAVGGKFLGYFNVPKVRRVAVMSGESGLATIQETALRICSAAGVRLEETNLIFSDTLPRFGDLSNMTAFRRFLDRDAIEVIIVDPAYLCLSADINAANLFDVGRLLRSVSESCQQAGATLVLAHHLKKGVANPYAPGQLEDIGWAGFQEFFRQWLMLNRREPYEPGSGLHHLWFSSGGSAGHGCLVGLDIYEGVYDPTGQQPRVWEVQVLKSAQVLRDAEQRRQETKDDKANRTAQTRLQRDMSKIMDVLARCPTGDTLTSLTNKASLSHKRGRAAVDSLLELGQVVECEVVKGNNKRALPGYKLGSVEQVKTTEYDRDT